MKCKDCNCCEKGWFPSQPDKYVCIGVREPFVIDDINHDCTEYPEDNKIIPCESVNTNGLKEIKKNESKINC